MRRVDDMRARRQYHDDLFRDWLEVGAEVAGALKRDDLLLGWLDTDMPEDVLIVACMRLLAVTTLTPPMVNSAVGPILIRRPPMQGPVAVNWPSLSRVTVNVPWKGSTPSGPCLPPRSTVISAPSPAACAASAAAGSAITHITAPSALLRTMASSRPVVSPVPPQPGLSCVSARRRVCSRSSRSPSPVGRRRPAIAVPPRRPAPTR